MTPRPAPRRAGTRAAVSTPARRGSTWSAVDGVHDGRRPVLTRVRRPGHGRVPGAPTRVAPAVRRRPSGRGRPRTPVPPRPRPRPRAACQSGRPPLTHRPPPPGPGLRLTQGGERTQHRGKRPMADSTADARSAWPRPRRPVPARAADRRGRAGPEPSAACRPPTRRRRPAQRPPWPMAGPAAAKGDRPAREPSSTRQPPGPLGCADPTPTPDQQPHPGAPPRRRTGSPWTARPRTAVPSTADGIGTRTTMRPCCPG